MHRSQLLLSIALVALAACNGEAPTNPPIFVPGPETTASQNLEGVLASTNEDPISYFIRRDDESIVYLIVGDVMLEDGMIGERVWATGKFSPNGEFIVERLQRIGEKPTDGNIAIRHRRPF